MELFWTLNDKSQSLMGCLERKTQYCQHRVLRSDYPLYASAGAFDKRDAHTPGRVKGSDEFVVPVISQIQM